MVSRPPTEDELVERARGGDGAAFASLVRAHEEIAFRTAYLITRNAADAEDAAQEGFVKAHRALVEAELATNPVPEFAGRTPRPAA